MINPSAAGWIQKFFSLLHYKSHTPDDTIHLYYSNIRNTGFIYGHVTYFINLAERESRHFTIEERTKVALLSTLYQLYTYCAKNNNHEAFITDITAFYNKMAPESFSLFRKVLPTAGRSQELEDILAERIKTNDNIISRNFSHILTNALLFMDVIAYKHYLRERDISEKYIQNLEGAVINIVSLALKTKQNKSEYDTLLIRLFESSVRYTKFSKADTIDSNKLQLDYFKSRLERNYILDMACMAMWTDGTLETAEIQFLYDLGRRLNLDDENVTESIASYDVFIKLHRKNIPYFKYSNPVKHFYDNAVSTVSVLIRRNSRRLTRELSNNGELMMLLTHSTHRSLTAKEKKKVKRQLLEICKTIPSLTIFLVPGGSLLLPLLIKFIPQLLPAMFNENMEKE